MDELKFVLRSLFFACLIILLSQIKFGDEKLETKAEFFLNRSEVGQFLHRSADGGAKFLSDIYSSGMGYIQNKLSMKSSPSHSTVSKAQK